jgi:hypothetical protein
VHHTVSTGFAIPRVAIPALLLQTGGGKRTGEIYVMEGVPQHAGPETPLDMLNRPEGFFPFRPKDDGHTVLLVSKARTVALTVPRTMTSEDPDRISAARTGGWAHARGRITLSGSATIEMPQHHSRLLTISTRRRSRFLRSRPPTRFTWSTARTYCTRDPRTDRCRLAWIRFSTS